MAERPVEPVPMAVGRVAVAVVDPDDKVRTVLTDHVRRFDIGAAAYDDLPSFMAATDARDPAVVVVGPSSAEEDVFTAVEQLLAARPTSAVVMVVFVLTADLLQRAMRAGVADVLEVSAEDDELIGAIKRASSRIPVRAAAVPPPPPPPAAGAPPARGRVVTVFCTKGGAGKSVVAINLAVALARRTIQPVVLVDADLQFGDVALMLRLQPAHTIAEAVLAGDRLDGSLLGSLLLRHEPSGLLVLAAPTEPGSADQIGQADLGRILEVLREHCAYIVVDTSASFGEVTLASLKEADDILVLASLDVMSLKSARVGLQTMRVLGIPFSRVKFVLNRANTRVGLTEADAGRALQMKVDAALPSELVVAESVNRGMPVIMSSPRSKFAKVIEALADTLAVPAPGAGTA